MKLNPPSKYTTTELEGCLGQDCELIYFGKTIKGKLIELRLYQNTNPMCVIQIKNKLGKEAFFIQRIVSIPFLDNMKNKSLYRLIYGK